MLDLGNTWLHRATVDTSNFLLKSGGNMTGTLTLEDAAATDTAMAMKIAGVTTNITAAQVKGLGDGYLPLAGGTMTGTLTVETADNG
jgi:hypothetical protein